MTAEKAREKASSLNLDVNANLLRSVQDVIAKAVEKGKFSTYYYENINNAVKERLIIDGYKIEEYSDFKEGLIITIAW